MIKFTKMEGIGNDYVYVNLFEETIEEPNALAKTMSDRHFGVGADGLICIAPSDVADAKMIMYNADGSLSEMCGNGLRCVAKYVYDHKICQNTTLNIETGAGVLTVKVFLGDDGNVSKATVNMGEPVLQGLQIPSTWDLASVVDQELSILDRTFKVTAVGMGNPHCINYVDDCKGFELEKYGPVVENDSHFPNRVNFEIVQVISPTELIQRTWERGSGETLACGTGAAAVCVAGVLTGISQRKILIHLLGGDLELEWNETDNCVYKTGPATEVFTGIFKA